MLTNLRLVESIQLFVTPFYISIYQNKSNFDAHYEGTGPEIWRQTNGHLNAFVSGAGALKYHRFPTCTSFKHDDEFVGTGGTVAGVGRYLKSKNGNIIVAISDPDGSGLYNKVLGHRTFCKI